MAGEPVGTRREADFPGRILILFATVPSPATSRLARETFVVNLLGETVAINKGGNDSRGAVAGMNGNDQAASVPLAIACKASHPRLGTPSFRKRFDT